MNKIKLVIIIAIIINICSCEPKSKDNLVIGTWIPYKNGIEVPERIVFKNDNTFLAQSVINGKPNTEYTSKYSISTDNKNLIIEDANSKRTVLEIIELTNTEMKLVRVNSTDTALFKKNE